MKLGLRNIHKQIAFEHLTISFFIENTIGCNKHINVTACLCCLVVNLALSYVFADAVKLFSQLPSYMLAFILGMNGLEVCQRILVKRNCALCHSTPQQTAAVILHRNTNLSIRIDT